jgi:hypothetical protein
VEHCYKIAMGLDHKLAPWAVRHASWLITNFLIKVDGKTSHERLRGRPYRGEIAEFGETVHNKIAVDTIGKADDRWAVGIWLGKTLRSDEHMIGNEGGCKSCRSIWRRPETKRFEKPVLDRMVGTPWDPVPASVREVKPRSVYITVDRILQLGKTENCPGCLNMNLPHTAACRERFGKLVEEDKLSKAAAKAAPVQQAVAAASAIATPVAGGDAQPATSQVALAPPAASAADAVPMDTTVRSPKRPAQDQLDPNMPEPDQMMIGALPTLHETDMLAAPVGTHLAYLSADGGGDAQVIQATVEWDRKYYASKSGEELDPLRVLEGRQKELDNIVKFKVKTDMAIQEAKAKGIKIVNAKWLDDKKPVPDEECPGGIDEENVRSRMVATELNLWIREDCTQSTPPRKAFRFVLSVAATKVAPDGSRRRLIVRYDVRVAFFHAPGDGKTAVMPPKELRKPGIVWFLNKAMYGTRSASQLFGSYVIDCLQAEGFEPIRCMPMVFVHIEMDVEVGVHGDDFFGEGEKDSLDWFDKVMIKHFDVKIMPRIGPPEFGGQATSGEHLRCTVSWSEKGFTWAGNTKHVNDLVELMGFTEDSKGCDTPSTKDTGKGVRTSLDPLNSADASHFRSAAGTLQYIAQDVLAVKQATAEVMQGMTTPLEIHSLRLKRAARYLQKYPGEVWHYNYQENPGVLDEICDSDWAGDAVTRKSVSCIIERFGGHILDGTVSKQKPIALSSGEAEFYPIVKAGAHAIQSKATLEAFGFKDLVIRIHSDSSAARGIVQRQGPGKLRHLDIKDLWIQEFIRTKKAEIVKVLTDVNWADIGTKPLPKARLEELLAMMPITRREGLEWTGKASAALAFLATLGVAAANTGDIVLVEGTGQLQVNEPNTNNSEPWPSAMLVAYMLVVHCLAAMTVVSTVRRLRRLLFSTTMTLAADDDLRIQQSSDPASVDSRSSSERIVSESENRRTAEALLADFRVDQLKELCRCCKLAVGGPKSALVYRFLGQESRASDKQLTTICSLLKRDHTKMLDVSDIVGGAQARVWIQRERAT